MKNGGELLDKIMRYKGSLIGLAVGDCMGVPAEFKRPGTFEPIQELRGGGVFDLKIGEYTDDTAMALCLAESLLECNGFDAEDQMKRYVRWYREGYLSSNGTCFDIGNATCEALETFEQTGDPFSGSTDPYSAGNGSIMRLAPVPLFYDGDMKKAIHLSVESSRTTHAAPEVLDACRYFSGLILGALQEENKETLLSPLYTPVKGTWESFPLSERLFEVANGSFKEKQPPDIQGSGYVVKSIEAALWAFYHSNSFTEGLLKAVNLGDDADTTGAIYGQLAGAYYGIEEVPEEWSQHVVNHEYILKLGEDLCQKSLL